MSDLSELVKVLWSAPQVRVFFPFGIAAGAFFGMICWRKPLKLIVTTAIFVIPPMILLGGDHSQIGGFTIIMMALYISTGFVGFSAGWLPGVWFGCLCGMLFGSRRSDADMSPDA